MQILSENIPFDYPLEGCEARATAMALAAEKRGFYSAKIYAEGWLQAKTTSHLFPLGEWSYHVAIVLFVEQQNGEINLMVFDPSISGVPLDVQQWKDQLQNQTNEIPAQVRDTYFGSRYQYYPRGSAGEHYKSHWHESDLTTMQKSLELVRGYRGEPYAAQL